MRRRVFHNADVEPAELIAGKYRLRSRLGEGGMAEVWAASNVLTGREFAIKLILPRLTDNAEAVERFFLEAKAAGRLRHPSIVNVFDVGRTKQGRPFLVMERLRGESLEERLRRERKLTPLATAVLVSQLARALDLAHRAGVVHRDLSTANVFLTPGTDGGEIPKILDFGVSKITSSGMGNRVRTGDGAVLGSPAYMSPEQARGAETVDGRTDVWALGVLAYECVSGRPPFAAANYNALMLRIVTSAHCRIDELVLDIDPGLARVIESCLVKDRDFRTASAVALAEELEVVARRLSSGRRVPGLARRATDRLPVSASSGGRLWQFLGRRPVAGFSVGGAVGGTAIGMCIGVALVGAHRGAPSVEPVATHTQRPVRIEPSPTTLARAVQPEADLVRATAHGLGIAVPQRRKRAAKKPVTRQESEIVAKTESPPRDNPY